MTSERLSFEERARLNRINWQKYCPGVDEVLKDHLLELGGTERRHVDPLPGTTVIWHNGDIGHSVTMALYVDERPRLTIWGAVWADDEDKLERYKVEATTVDLQTPVTAESFKAEFERTKSQLRLDRSELLERGTASTFTSRSGKTA